MHFRIYCLICTGYVTIQTQLGNVKSADEESWKIQVKYFKSVRLDCTPEGNHTRVRLWVLPDGEVVRPDKDKKANHVALKDDGHALEIDRVDDDLFGLYLCIVDVENDIQVIRHGLNIDGPYYGPDYEENIKHNAMIGGICAGGVLVILVSVWIIHKHWCKSTKDRYKKSADDGESANTDKENKKSKDQHADDNSIGKEAETLSNGTDTLEKIYDQADGIVELMKYRAEITSNGVKTEKMPVSPMGSGDYHSIVDLENVEHFINTKRSSTASKPDSECQEGCGCEINDQDQDSQNIPTSGLTEKEGDNGELNDSNSSKLYVSEKEELTSVVFTDKDGSEIIYATPKKPKRKQEKETVIIIEGDVVIEENGAKVVVTSSPATPVVMSDTGNAVKRLADNVLVASGAGPAQVDSFNRSQSNVVTLEAVSNQTDSHSEVNWAISELPRRKTEMLNDGSIDVRL